MKLIWRYFPFLLFGGCFGASLALAIVGTQPLYAIFATSLNLIAGIGFAVVAVGSSGE